jgi:hypothetical protein
MDFLVSRNVLAGIVKGIDMLWTQVKSWAKDHGYSSFREKVKDEDNKYDYYWAKDDDPTVTGLSTSVSKLAKDIYNHITKNAHIKYQEEYILNKEDIKFTLSDY